MQTSIAAAHQENYSLALASVAVAAAIVIAVLTAMGREARDVNMAALVQPA